MGKYLRRSDGTRTAGDDLEGVEDAGEAVRPQALRKAVRAGQGGVQLQSERDLARWSALADRMRERDHAAAVPLLGRLALVLPQAHVARPGVLAALAHVLCELGRFDRALAVASEALRLDPNLQAAADTARRAGLAVRV